MESLGAIMPRVNYGLAPRANGCWVCKSVGAPEDVTFRLLDEEGAPQPFDDAIDYLISCGYGASRTTWRRRLTTHRDHVQSAMSRGFRMTPAHIDTGAVTVLEPPKGSPTWLRSTDRAIDLGDSALEILQDRLEEMKTDELLKTARLGVSAAAKRGDWEAKGRQLGQMDSLMHLISGMGGRNAD